MLGFTFSLSESKIQGEAPYVEWPSKTTCHFRRIYKYYLGYNIQSSSFLESFSKWGDDGQERGTCNTRAEKKKDHLRLSETPEKAPLEKI